MIAHNGFGFTIQVNTRVDAPPRVVYEQFVRVSDWWLAEHTYFGDLRQLVIEANAGGCFCERSGERTVLHMLVTFVVPGQEMRLTGGLGPLQMMGLAGGMSWRFDADESGGTNIVHHYPVSGGTGASLESIARAVDGVQRLLVELLRRVVDERALKAAK